MSSDRPAGSGLLLVISAPSGTGKTTLVDELVRRLPGVEQSRSYTSRPPRAGEREGVDYNFVSRDTFDRMVAGDEFLEWARDYAVALRDQADAQRAALKLQAQLNRNPKGKNARSLQSQLQKQQEQIRRLEQKLKRYETVQRKLR